MPLWTLKPFRGCLKWTIHYVSLLEFLTPLFWPWIPPTVVITRHPAWTESIHAGQRQCDRPPSLSQHEFLEPLRLIALKMLKFPHMLCLYNNDSVQSTVFYEIRGLNARGGQVAGEDWMTKPGSNDMIDHRSEISDWKSVYINSKCVS